MSECVIDIKDLSKVFRIFRNPRYRVLDVFGLPVPRSSYEQCWALRDVNLSVPSGQRLGIIGSNGAGKSTLLKILAGLVPPTRGAVSVRGRVQALMELGTGFHPEFTGRQNVFAALGYRGITGADARRCFEEIVEFSELREVIERPLSTYSSGMYARLAFSVATSVKPEVLIVDEILSAGDAYFSGKCLRRMQQLTSEGGATVLFVSHDLHAVQALCTRALWLEKGRVMQDGDPLTIVKAYYQAVQEVENRRFLEQAATTDRSREAGRREESGDGQRAGERSPHSIVTWQVPDPRIDTVRFLNAKLEPVTGIQEGEDLIVDVHYTATTPAEQPVFGMSIYRLDSTPLCRAVSTLGGLTIPRLSGRGKVRFVFAPFYGGPGDYVVSASIFKHLSLTNLDRSVFYDAHDRAYPFRVWKELGISVDMGLLRNPYQVEHLHD
jgi:ABC-type polysaccharide/polyol phosphate transport system ATPase subunit